MDDFCSSLFCFHHPLKTNGMIFGHVRTHDEDGVRVHEIRQGGGGASPAKACAQTGHGGAVSYTGLVADANHAQAGGEQFLNQIVFFVVESGPAQMRDGGSVHHGFAIFLFEECALS